MLTSLVVRIVDFCSRQAWLVTVASLLIAAGCSFYTTRHFAINSDINALLSDDIGWRKRERAFEQAFGRFERITVVVQAPTPELAGAATAELAKALKERTDRFRSVNQPAGGEFFARNGLLFLPVDELKKTLDGLVEAETLVNDLATDESLRGLTSALGDVLLGIQSEKIKLDDAAPVFDKFSTTIEDVVAGRPASFSWQALARGGKSDAQQLRGFIDVRPILDYAALEPGHAATATIREIAAGIAPKYQATVRLTGPVAMADEEFATIKENIVLNSLITLGIALFILWLALRSARLILAVFINVFVGLAITAAVGLLLVGSLNPISVSFAVLFIGIGVDFGIQYSVRYRSERHDLGGLSAALKQAGRLTGAPLTLAAGATAAGFLSFLPTHYRGVSELGLIAGFGMIIAFVTSVTLLPALIRILKPPGEPEELGFKALAPLDEFMERHRVAILVGTAAVVIAGLPLLYFMKFDFDPVNLRSPKVESIATYLELSRDPQTNTNAVGVLAPSLDDAIKIADRLSKAPGVGHVLTLATFVPDQQQAKLKLIHDAWTKLAPAFDPKSAMASPTDEENVETLKEVVNQLGEVAKDRNGAGVTAIKRLQTAITSLADAKEDTRKKADEVLVGPLRIALAGLKTALNVSEITRAKLPAELVADWVTPTGQARVEAAPKGDPTDNQEMRRFARAVLAVEPSAIEGPISILEAGDTVVRAFIEAGLWALLSIGILLWIVLRRLGDVLLTLIPLLIAGIVTLEVCVLIGLPLNFANIIALPLLLGIGVAFKIYYIMAWRAGQTNLLQTALTRAVIFSALTTATAFGSLWFSSHPGTSSMGKLLALSLLCTLAAAVLFQPLLMGKPRETVSTDEA
jgi:hopanoid biosynthesis associated RND transporter like protein HpnN